MIQQMHLSQIPSTTCHVLYTLHTTQHTLPSYMCPALLFTPAGFWTIGTVIQAALAYALLNGKGWRILVLVSTTPYVLLLMLLPFVPESPRFLLVKGRVDAAQQVLHKVLRVCGKELPEGSLQLLLSDDSGGDRRESPEGLTGKRGEYFHLARLKPQCSMWHFCKSGLTACCNFPGR